MIKNITIVSCHSREGGNLDTCFRRYDTKFVSPNSIGFTIDKKSKKIICTNFANGKKHDFKLFKESKILIHPEVSLLGDSGYQGMKKLHSNSFLPKKKSKKKPLTNEDKKNNQNIASQRVTCEHIIGRIKRFKIIADRYRNRRKRFALRVNLIAGICNFET